MDTEFDLELAGTSKGSTFAEVYGGDPPSRVIMASQRFAVLVDLAPMVVGHLLVIPRRKVLSFASLDDEEWEEWLQIRDIVLPALEARYAVPAVLMEHGSDPSLEANACILHAHMHVLPLPRHVQLNFESDGFATRPVDPTCLREAGVAAKAYFYGERVGQTASVAEVVGQSRPPSQYLRRVIARQTGDADAYDWGIFGEHNRLRRTVRDLGDLASR